MKRKLVLLLVSIILCGSAVFAQNNHFTGYTGGYSSHLNTWLAVELDGVRLESTDIEVGAFVDGEFRGTQRLAYWSNYDSYLACIQIFKDNAGDVISFKMYDHATQTEYDNCPITVTTQVAGEEMGATPMDPTVLVFTSPDTPTPSGPEHPWNPPTNYPSNMTIFAEIQINGEPVSGDNWEVGAFCNGECRGDHVGFETAPTSFGYMMTILVYGVAGDVINFYLYDIENESIVGECSTTVTYVEQGNAGVVWDPFILNFVTLQTFTKDIAAYTENGGYYLIATPIGEVSPANVTNMLANNYDLYYFDQSQDLEWINYKAGDGSTNPGFNLVPGKGYLYANSNNVTLTFTGAPYEGDGEVTLYKDDNADLVGWNLVGNPFAQTAYIDKPFYTMNLDGSEVVAGEGNEIGAMEGIFVVAEEDEETVTFSTEPIEAKSQIVLNVSKDDRGNVIDRAVVRIGQSELLPKFMLNPTNTKMYISKNGNDYSVVRSNKSDKLPVNFEPAEDGTYTININVENANLKYLHLIDRLAGVDLDMLQNSSYRFEAKTKDKPNRFILEFKVANNPFHQLFVKDDTNTFGFFSNGEWIINNEGDAILQVVDVNGQIMSNEEINGSVSKHIDAAPGVYMLRLIKGKDIKVQKIVIK